MSLEDTEMIDKSNKNGDSEETVSENDKEVCPLREELLDHVSCSKARFKNEQRGDPELQLADKREIASKLLNENPGQFLARFGNFIAGDKLKYFDNIRSEDYEVEFHLQRLVSLQNKKATQVEVKNRRYAALKKLVSEGKYFSETEMRRRNPLLYEQLVGQYLSAEELDDINHLDMNSMTLLGFMLEHMERGETASLRVHQQQLEESAMEETDSSSEEEDEVPVPAAPPGPVTEEERDLLRQEFVTSMYHSFLKGQDPEFDYSMVDENAEYDSVEVQQRDAEDSYFDSETPQEAARSALDSPAPQPMSQEEEEEDELEAYMKSLPPVAQQVDWPGTRNPPS